MDVSKGLIENLDDPLTTVSRRDIFQRKQFLKQIYLDWYALIKGHLPSKHHLIIELGSGAGFIQDLIPAMISSDVLFLPFIDVVINGLNLPFSSNSVDSYVMVNVFHHLPQASKFLNEVNRTLRKGGRLIMIEPWINNWSRWVYANFHYEWIDVNAEERDFPSSGPLSGANQAQPWIFFERDILEFKKSFSTLTLLKIEPFMPVSYLLSGGLRRKFGLPSWSYTIIKGLETALLKGKKWGMFSLIVLEKSK